MLIRKPFGSAIDDLLLNVGVSADTSSSSNSWDITPVSTSSPDSSSSGGNWWGALTSLFSAGGSVASSLINKDSNQATATQKLQTQASVQKTAIAAQSSTTNTLILGGLGVVALLLFVGMKKS